MEARGRSRRLMVAGIGFVAFESLLIGVFGDYFYADLYAAPVMWGMVLLAGAGYFALGFFSRSWWSAPLLLVPLVVAALVGPTGPTVGFAEANTVRISENPDLDQLWLIFSLIFVPAWALGVLSAILTLARRPVEQAGQS